MQKPLIIKAASKLGATLAFDLVVNAHTYVWGLRFSGTRSSLRGGFSKAARCVFAGGGDIRLMLNAGTDHEIDRCEFHNINGRALSTNL